jgi:lactoylglutathione lyase
MKYLHTMVRVSDIEASLRFYRDALGLELLSRRDNAAGRFTPIFLAAPGDHCAQTGRWRSCGSSGSWRGSK